MILLIDVGNTRIKWSPYDSQRLGVVGSTPHGDVGIPDELTTAWKTLPPPNRVLMASVTARPSEAIRNWVHDVWGVRVFTVQVGGDDFGIRCGYDDPLQLGVDRWVALVGARQIHKGDLCVVDCGTAITVDGLTGDGRHLGGFIMPGLGLMRRSLASDTGELPQVSGVPPLVPARETRGGILGGTLHAAVGGVLHALESAWLDMGRSASSAVILTGGEAPLIEPYLGIDVSVEPALVLRGLARMADAGQQR
jgi:type III pantothenate kinase